MNAYLFALFILLFILLLVFLTFKNINEDKDWINPWKDFSLLSGLVYEPGTTLRPAIMIGTYRSYFMKIELGQVASFESGASWKYTRITLDLGRQSNGRFLLKEKRLFGKWHINHRDKESFEKFFTVEGQPMDLVNQVLDADDIRQRLFQLHPSHLSVDEDRLLFYSEDSKKDIKKIKYLIDLLCDIAAIVTDRKRYFKLNR